MIVNNATFKTYNARDCVGTYDAWADLKSELKEFGQLDFYTSFVRPLAAAVYAMQMRGMPCDVGRLAKAQQDAQSKVASLREELRPVGAAVDLLDFNPSSNPQMAQFLGAFGLHSGRRTNKGALKADKTEIITALLGVAGTQTEPIFEKIIQYRGEVDDYGDFLKPIRPWPDGRVRARFLATTRTGRLQSRKWITQWGSGCEFQNIPDDMRRMYCAPPGYVFVQADASQLELVIMAYEAGVQRWVEAIAAGESIHVLNMMNVMRCTKEEALHAKAQHVEGCARHQECHKRYVTIKKFVFADNYWAELPTIQEQLLKEARILIPMSSLQDIMASYRSFLPEIEAWRNWAYADALANRQITNRFGRLRRLLEPKDKIRGISVNSRIQSTGADFINKGFLALHAEGHELVNQVHDSVVLLCRKEDAAATRDAIKGAFSHAIRIKDLDVRVKMDVSVGESWGEMEPFN